MPVWLTLAHAILVIPLVHYPLLTSKPRLPQWIELLVPNLAYALFWPLCRCNNPVYDYTWSLIISGFLSVRLLESSLLKNTETWTRHNYIEFLITSNNPRFTRKHVKDAWDAAGLRKWKPEDRGVGFYGGVVARQCVFLGVYAV